jgi:2-polyprenyl-3-methyl-5-hydroxy-6-metoxy-1,4-benzoquinol methylase
MTTRDELEYARRIQEEARFWDERAELLLSSGRIPLWFDHRRGEDVTFLPLDQLRGAGIRADPVLYRLVYSDMIGLVIQEATQKKGHALDLGCGSGWLSLELARHGMDVDGYDIGPTQIAIAQRFSKESQESTEPLLHGDFGSTNYQVVDLNHAVLEHGKYEVVVSMGTLHHIERLDHLLGEIYKSLKPDGKFLFYEYIGYSGLAGLVPLAFKTVGALPKLARRIAGSANTASSSAFEGVSDRQILELVETRFSVERMDFRFLFLPILVSSLRIFRLPHVLSVPLVRFLSWTDKTLTDSGVLRGPYVLAMVRK